MPLKIAVSGPRLEALARKYGALSALRARRDGDGPAATRDELRALAGEFPGCLRELDTLGGAEIDRRAAACADAARGGPTEPWMAWIAAYHEVVVETLAERARRSRARSKDGAEGPVAGARPERLNATVMRALAVHFGVPAASIARALFPLRRPSPYRL